MEFSGPEGLFHGGLNGVELVVPGHFLDEFPAPVVVEHDEVSQEGQKVVLVADPFQHHLELGEVGGAGFLVVHGLPGLEPLLPCGQGTDPGVEAVGDWFIENRVGSSALYVWSCCQASQTSVFSSAGFFSSMMPRGRPFRKRTMSARRVD